jgi:hypothetical protein
MELKKSALKGRERLTGKRFVLTGVFVPPLQGGNGFSITQG